MKPTRMRIHPVTAVPALCGLLLLNLVSPCFSADAEDGEDAEKQLFGDKVVATGRGFEIKESEIEESFIQYKATAAAQGENVGEAQRKEIEGKILDKLIAEKMLLQIASPEDRERGNTMAQEYIDRALQEAGSESAYQRQLQSLGMTRERFERRIREKMAMDTVLERKLKSTIEVTDAEAKRFYEENPQRFEEREQVTVSHILLSTFDPRTRKSLPASEKNKKKLVAEKLLDRARAGEDFARLAEEYSDDKGAKGPGGTYTFARGMMEPGFEAAAFSLKPDQISDLVETPYGYHIVKLHSRKPARKLSYEEVRERLKALLIQEKFASRIPGYLEELKQEFEVKVAQ